MEINLILCSIDFSEFSRVPFSLFAFDCLGVRFDGAKTR